MLALLFLLALPVLLMVASTARAQQAAVGLGTADSFAVLAGSTVTNTGSTVVNGDLGVSPGNATPGFPPGTVNGTIHAGDATAAQAQSDLTIAYNDAAGRACDVNLTGQDLGGMTLTAGAYCFSSSAQLTGAVTLDAQGDPSAVFIFQIGSTLTTASDSRVNLVNGADACNVFWQVGSSATLGTGTSFKGNILALESITLNTNATVVNGRTLARNGAVTLDANTITRATCAAAPPSPSPTASPSPTLTPSPTVSPSPTTSPGATPSPTTSPGVTPSPTTSPGATPSPTTSPGATPSPTTSPGFTPSPTTSPPSGDSDDGGSGSLRPPSSGGSATGGAGAIRPLPSGGPQTGGGSMARAQNVWLLVAGTVLLAGAVAAGAAPVLVRRGVLWKFRRG